MSALRTQGTHPAARFLKVSTGAPAPSLMIIAPTPRAFTFPTAHNLADSPYFSPSNSPFEFEVCTPVLSASSVASRPGSSRNDETPPLSTSTHTLGPASAPVFSPPAPAAICQEFPHPPETRRPKKGDNDYVKRPENVFILFRRKCSRDQAHCLSVSAPSSVASTPSSAAAEPSLAPGVPPKKQRQADLSKTISQKWKALSPEERAHWEALAEERKREHATLHPKYVYRPQRSRTRNRTNASSPSSCPTNKTSAPHPQSLEVVVPRVQGGRSASAPAHPPYQAIQIPNVYGSSFASDGSAAEDSSSLMPIISRLGVGNGNGGFDYLPIFYGAFESSDFL
ncbi:hypothetical protein DFH07DRAFT_552150 [Mycena maculata]|uniref:HMG box domain-containing protein n=1 Tax=Mycena maculata TaxID=230809 RepID=A0AAD7IVZ2_9AGAR|nr:hypothetical protein DFH07DRAFT_552150 [Mycena maculata]